MNLQRHFVLIGLVVGLARLGAQPAPDVTRQGAWWTQTSTGAVSAASLAKLRIDTRGPVALRGETAANTISYTLRKRVTASSPAQARAALAEFGIKTRTQGDWTILSVLYPERRGRVQADLEVVAPRRLVEAVLETHGGSVEALDLDCPVTAETGGGRIHMDRIGAQISVRTGGGDIVLGRIGGTVQCLSGGGSIRLESATGEAWFETAGGEIFVGEARGPVRASTNGGNIRIVRAGSTVSARTGGGLIDVLHAAGMVTANSSDGSIQVGSAAGVHCQAVSGAIRLKGVSGALRASTNAGSILAALTMGRIEESFLNTDAGDVTVFIPSNLAVTVRAEIESRAASRIVSDFPEIRLRAAGGAVAEGALNGGGPLLRIAAAGGTIYLRRQR